LAAFGDLEGVFAAVAFLGLAVAGGVVLAALALFWPLGAPFFRLAVFFVGDFSGATAAPCAPAAAFVLVVSAFSVVIFVRSPFAAEPRQDMNHSEVLIKQVDSAV
jgi:hypothetical protein